MPKDRSARQNEQLPLEDLSGCGRGIVIVAAIAITAIMVVLILDYLLNDTPDTLIGVLLY